MKGTRSIRLFEIWIPLAILLIGTLLFWAFPIDLKLAGHFHTPGEDAWKEGGEQPWKFLYDYGTWPGLAVGVGAIVAILLSIGIPKLRNWRKQCLFLMLAMLLGPGLFVNAVFKDHWGRPRPRDVADFGGNFVYEQVLEYDASSPGKSFPCGHASTAFYLLSGFLLLRHRRRIAAWITLAGALVLGTIVGIARIAQGGHFASDVLWSAAMCWFVSLALYYLLGLHRPGEDTRFDRLIKRAPKRFFMIVGAVILAGVAAILLATPHSRDLHFTPSTEALPEHLRHRLSLILETGDVSLRYGESLNIHSRAEGFGVPGSKMKPIFHEKMDDEKAVRMQLKMRKSGFFTELDHDLNITLDRNRSNYFKFEVTDGSVELILPKNETIRLDLGDTPLNAPAGLFSETKKAGVFENGKSPVTTLVLRLSNGSLTVTPIEGLK